MFDAVAKGGGVLRRGTPFRSSISSKYDLVIQGPVTLILIASAPTVFLLVPLKTMNVSPRVSIVSKDSITSPKFNVTDALL